MPTASVPGMCVLSIFDQLIEKIKTARPVKTDGKALTLGFVYSQMLLGMPIDPNDYAKPWTPMGGSTLQDVVKKLKDNQSQTGTQSTAGGAGSAASSDGAGTAVTPIIDPKFQRAMEAAYKTSALVDTRLVVTKDSSYLQYPSQPKISFAYEGIINGMQPSEPSEMSQEIKKRVDAAKKVLYELDSDGEIVGDSRAYESYKKNAQRHADAKAAYEDARSEALADRLKADSWPMKSVSYQRRIDAAWDDWKTQGAEKVERALDVIESVGVDISARMIAKARKKYDAWNLGLAGAPDPIPYSYIDPSGWADPDSDDSGWQTLTVTSAEINMHSESHDASRYRSRWESSSSSSSGSGGLSLGFAFFGGGSGKSQSSSSANSFSASSGQYKFHNDASSLEITITYQLCTIKRPWLVGDLFYMRNWYLVNNAKNAVSDGKIDSQAESEKPLLPMIPSQMLVIRNVTIKFLKKCADMDTFSSYYNSFSSDSKSEEGHVKGGGGFSLGFISAGGGGSHSSSSSEANAKGKTRRDSSFDYGWKYDKGVLEIKGAQIIGWLSEIVPACAPLDDPKLKKKPSGR